jgi:cyclopropane-fatty-acyl-phospholipid synthase
MLSRAVRRGSLDVIFPSGAAVSYGDGAEPKVAIELLDKGAVWAIYLDPGLKFAEMYMDGRMIVAHGGLDAFVALVKINGAKKFATIPAAAITLSRVAGRLWRRYVARETAQRNVAHHYDLDEELFRLFLDEDLQYSCAYFERADVNLEEAQRAKKRHIAAKMMLEPGHRVLDIGCGWGGMSIFLAEAYGAHVKGVTLSTEQMRVGRQRAEERGLADRVQIELQDYRDVEGPFDRIVSVGMFEHVGPQNFKTYFRTARRLMADDGVFLLHSIGRARPNLSDPPFFEKYIFPNGHIPALSETLKAIEQAGLLVKDIEILTFHYADTLKHWRKRFHANRNEVLKLYDERFFRMWDLYLATSEASFRHGKLFNFQIQLVKKQTTSRPTRDYMRLAEDKLR